MKAGGQSFGSYRVGVSFNPSSNPEVDQVKQATAHLIDNLEAFKASAFPEAARCAALAQTAYEEACMWAVKAITKTEA